jgi:hypothetical protein
VADRRWHVTVAWILCGVIATIALALGYLLLSKEVQIQEAKLHAHTRNSLEERRNRLFSACERQMELRAVVEVHGEEELALIRALPIFDCNPLLHGAQPHELSRQEESRYRKRFREGAPALPPTE